MTIVILNSIENGLHNGTVNHNIPSVNYNHIKKIGTAITLDKSYNISSRALY